MDATQTAERRLSRQLALRLRPNTLLAGLVMLALLLTLVVYLILPYLAWRWLNHPFLGAFVEQTLVFNGVRPASGSRWAGIEAGLTYPHHLRSVDGQPVRTAGELSQLLERYDVGQTVRLEYADALRQSQAVQITLQAFPPRDALAFFVIPYFIGLGYLVAGLWVFRLRRMEAAGRAFALFCCSVAIIIGALFDLYTTKWFVRLWTAAIPVGAGALITLGLVFPQEAALVTGRPALRWIGFAPAIYLIIAAERVLYDYSQYTAYARAWLYAYQYAGLAILFFLGMSLYRRARAASPIAREQSRLILIGSALAFLPIFIYFGLATLSTASADPPAWVAAASKFNAALYLPPLVLFPLAVAYAILRYRLLDTDIIVGRALVYASLAVVTAVGYGLLVFGASLVTGSLVPANNPGLLALLVFALVLGLNPLRRKTQQFVDAIFFRSARAYRERLQDFARQLTQTVDLSEIIQAVKKTIDDAVRPAHIYVYLRGPANDYRDYAPPGRRAGTDIRFAENGGLARLLSRQPGVLYLTPDAPLPPDLIGERARLAVIGSTVYVPLPGKSGASAAGGQPGVAGWLALGARLSGEPYTREDLTFLEAIADQAAIAVERAQVISDLERRVTELNVLGQVSQAVNFSIAFNDLLELVYAQASKVVDAANFHIVLYDRPSQTLAYVFFVERDERISSAENRPWPMGQGLISEVIRTGQPLLTDDYRAECDRRRVAWLQHPFRAWMGVPLNAGAAGTLGAMSVASFTPGQTFTDDQVKIFWAIADQAATAIEKSRLYQQTEARARQLATLNAVAQTLTSTLDLDALLQQIVASAVSLLNSEAGSLLLIDAETGEYIFTVTTGPVAPDLIGRRLPAGEGAAGAAVLTGRPAIINDAQADPRWYQGADQTTGFVTRSVLAAPLRSKDHTLGALEIINKRDGSPFNEEDQDLVMAFASQAAVSIENARLYTQTDQALAARVDELTMIQRIDRELNAALDIDRVLSITLDWALRQTGAEAGAVGIVVPEGVQLIAMQGYPDGAADYRQKPIPTHAGIIGRVVRTGQASLVTDVWQDPDYLALRPDTAAQLTLPIRSEEATIGVIALESPDAGCFSQEHVQFMTRLADHASVAVTNARLYSEVQAANLAKSEFVSFVSHELKTPMTSIKGYADLLAQGAVGPVTDMQANFLNTIRSNVDRMATLVSDLADISRIEAGRMRLEMATIPFQAVIDEVVRSTANQIASKGQTLVQAIEPNLPAIWGDQVRLVQVLTNLVSNANKYTPSGGTITLRVEQSNNLWDPEGAPRVLHVSVRDTGIGISPEDQQRIFTKFFRAEDRAVREIPGTGLGLNIFKNLVELQGGKAWFESQLGQGSTFHFTVPVAR